MPSSARRRQDPPADEYSPRGSASAAARPSPSVAGSFVDPSVFRPPLKPSRRLFAAAALLVAAWLAVLLTLYFSAVFPRRHDRPTTPRDATDAPATLPAGSVAR